MKHRTLGRTKLQVSELGLGLIKTDNPAVIQRALDHGINYFDTAASYRGGNSEVVLGRALKGRRDQAIVATKWHTNGRTPAKALLDSLDGSLQRLGTDHVDLIQIHGAGRPVQVNSDELWEAFTQARKAGKVRFHGLSTHRNQVAVVRAAIKSGRYDQVLVSHNALTAERIGPALGEAHKAGVGVVIMKALEPAHASKGTDAFAGLRGNPYQKCIQWVLKDSNVSTVIVDMPTFDELQEDVAAATTLMTRAEQREFELAVAQVSTGTCHLCGACTGQCPAGVQVSDIMRYALYHDGYGDRARARSLYRELSATASAAVCRGCDTCAVVCPWGVPVRSRLERAHAIMA
jgi:predicted aldo/keto reductase-like oxidoreductase